MSLFNLGRHTLHSGAESHYLIHCESLCVADIACLAWMAREVVGPFRQVIGIPRGGLRLAEALKKYAGDEGPVLLVDDVFTTGGSMEQARKEYLASMPGLEGYYVTGVVIFARGMIPIWVKALFQLPPALWLKQPVGLTPVG